MALTSKKTNLSMANARVESAAPTELNPLLSVFTQGSVRAFGTLATLGFAGVPCLRHSHQHHQPIQQQAQTTTPPNQSDSKRK